MIQSMEKNDYLVIVYTYMILVKILCLQFKLIFLLSNCTTGAIAWSIASILVGPFIDTFGYNTFFVTNPIGCIFVCASTYIYYKESDPQGTSIFSLELVPSIGSIVSSGSTLSMKDDGVINFDEEYDKSRNDFQDDNVINPSALEPRGLGEIPGHEINNTEQVQQENREAKGICSLMCGNLIGFGFLVSAVTLNMGTSVVENLIFLYFQELGGSSTICGITVLVTVLFEIPIFHWAPKLLSRYGPQKLQKVACIAYIIRVVGYTFVPQNHASWILLLEPMHGVTYACGKTASVEFAAMLSTKGSEATYQGMLSMILGIGSFVGLFLGGYIEDTLGSIILYRSYAGVVCIGLITFMITSRQETQKTNANIFSLHEKSRRRTKKTKRKSQSYHQVNQEQTGGENVTNESMII